MRITWFLLVGVLIAMVLSILLIDNRIPAPPSDVQAGGRDTNPLTPAPQQQ